MNADPNPKARDNGDISEEGAVNSPEINSRNASPKTGTRTIKKENFAISSFFNPSSIPVEIVAPDLDNPGNTAMAWEIPITNALPYVSFFSAGFITPVR